MYDGKKACEIRNIKSATEIIYVFLCMLKKRWIKKQYLILYNLSYAR